MLRVLTYHRVAPLNERTWLDPTLISATPDAFAKQMSFLKTHYTVVHVDTVLEAVETGRELPKDSVLITFDDGYADFEEHAWPILRHYRLPVTMFVPTSFPDNAYAAFWWDRLYHAYTSARSDTRMGEIRGLLHYLKRLPHSVAMDIVEDICAKSPSMPCTRPNVLDWDQIRTLSRGGVTIGSHSRSHPILTQVPVNTLRAEIRESQRDLQTRLGDTLPIFCYPSGVHDSKVVETAAEEGIRLAFSTQTGPNDLATNPLQVRRTNITPRTTLPIFRVRLLPIGAHIDAWRNAA